MRKKRIGALVLFLVFAFSCCFSQAASELVKKEVLVSKSKTATYDAPKEIEENGKAYRLKEVTYKVLKTSDELKGEVEIKGLTEEKAPRTKKVAIDGKEYKLFLDADKTTYKKEEGEQKYVYEARDPYRFTPDQTRSFKGQDGNTLTGTLKSTSKGSNYGKGISIPGKFSGPANAKYFRFAGSGNLWPLDTAAPTWRGYEADILTHLGLNPSTHRITGGQWTGGSGGTRTAVFSGTQTVCDYTCTYTVDGGGDQYTANAVYSGFAIEATAHYEEYMTLKEKLLIGAAIGIAALAIAAILYFLKRKKNQAEDEVAGRS